MAVPVLSFGLIVLVGLAGLTMGILALSLGETTRGVGLTMGVVMLAVLAGGMALMLVSVRSVSPSPVGTSPVPARALVSAAQPLPAEKPLEEAKAPAATSEPEPITEATPADAPSAGSDDASAKPPWVDRPGHLQGTIYRSAVKSGLFVTPAECRQAIEPKLRAAVNDYIDEYLMPGASEKVSVDDELLKGLQKDDYLETIHSATVGPMQQLHVLLEFDDTARSELTRRWHQTIVNTRLLQLALACGTVLGLLAVAAAYLRLDLASSGQFRGRLKLGAGAAILLVMATAAVVRRTLLQ